VKDAHAETRYPLQRVGDVDRTFVLQNLRLVIVLEQLLDILLHDLVRHWRAIEKPRPAIHPDHRNRIRLEVQVRTLGLHHRLQKVMEGKTSLLHMNLGLGRVTVDIGILDHLSDSGFNRHMRNPLLKTPPLS
jgi:hypothetical protein